MAMISKFKTFALASVLATAAFVPSSLAAPQFYAGSDAELVVVAFNETQDATVTVDATRLFDVRDLIRLEYGAVNLDALLRVKQIIAPEGITVTLEDSEISRQNFANTLSLEFTVGNEDYNIGSFPVTVILENPESGKTVTINLVVLAQ
jgi:hypothetical protein